MKINRHIIIASHSNLAKGMKDTLEFFAGDKLKITVLTAYVDNVPIDETIKSMFENIDSDDEIVVLTDILGGSVNQKFFLYINRPHTILLTGMNLSLALAITMEPLDSYISPEKTKELVLDAQKQIKYENEISTLVSEEDE